MTKQTKKIVLLSLLIASCVAISILDSIISGMIFTFLPNIKLGLANIVVLLVIYNYGFRESILVAVIKSIIVGLLFNGLTAFIIGGTATLISTLAMNLFIIATKNKFSMVSSSFIGGIVHIIVQLVVVAIMYNIGESIFVYGLYTIIISIFSSIFVGLIAFYVNKAIKKYIESMS